ncbi:MAG: KTSC domain-containing protein [Gemmatimonadaceae bacterium]
MKRIPLTSTAILTAGYDGFERVLEVGFPSGSIYQYFDVPMDVYHDLLTTDSPGTYLDAELKKGGYRYQRVEEGGAETPGV